MAVMEATPLRWAVVGVGRAGLARARAIRADPRSELVCTWRGRNQHMVGNLAVRTLEVALAKVDAVAICSPDTLHGSQIAAALSARCHVVVEFPICQDADEARSLFQRARDSDRVLHVAHIELLHGPQQQLRVALRQNPASALQISFQRPGPELSQQALALGNIARLHRVVDIAGPVLALTEIRCTGDALTATLHSADATTKLRVQQGPSCVRGTVLDAQNALGHWRLTAQRLTLNDETRTLPVAPGLFFQDHLAAMARITRGCSGYIPESQILHILDLAERLAGGTAGPLPARL